MREVNVKEELGEGGGKEGKCFKELNRFQDSNLNE